MAKKIDTEETSLDLTSMIDVCFLLIAFFIMVTEVSKSEVVEIFLPFANYSVENTLEDRIVINVDRNGVIFMQSQRFGKPNIQANRDKITQFLQAQAKMAGFEVTGAKICKLTAVVRADAHTQFKFVQCLGVILMDPNVRMTKVHYSAKNPNKSS